MFELGRFKVANVYFVLDLKLILFFLFFEKPGWRKRKEVALQVLLILVLSSLSIQVAQGFDFVRSLSSLTFLAVLII